MSAVDPVPVPERLTALDFVLSEGSPEERQEFRSRLDRSLETALEVADAREFVEEFRSLDCVDDASPRLDVLLMSVRGQATRQARRNVTRRLAQQVSRRRLAARACGVVLVAAAILVGLGVGLRSWEVGAPATDFGGGPSWFGGSAVASADQRTRGASQDASTSESLAKERSQAEVMSASAQETASGLGQAAPEVHHAPSVAEMERFEARLVAARATLRHAGLTLDGQGDAQDVHGSYDTWIAASNELAVVRREFRDRFGADRRRAQMRRHGFNPDVDGRVQRIADTVAERMRADLDAGTARPESAALVMRALLASGSTPKMGRHRDVVSDLSAYLQDLLPNGEGEEPPLAPVTEAVVLGALMDLVILTDDALASRVAQRTTRLLEVVYASPGDAVSLDGLLRTQRRTKHGAFSSNDTHRQAGEAPDSSPRNAASLAQWATPVAAIGEAGRLFRLAPALGVDPDLAAGARTVLAAHLHGQAQLRSTDSAALLAALRYGFGDLVNRAPLDRKLRRWEPMMLLPEPVVLLQVTWSQFPVRYGWSDFQSGLRKICTAPTPEDPGDAAAFLLCLGMHFAAPGQSEARTRHTASAANGGSRSAL